MKKQIVFVIGILLNIVSFVCNAQCSVDISVQVMKQEDIVPENLCTYLTSRLQQLVTELGSAAETNGISRFFITGYFGHTLIDNLPGPPAQTALHGYLSLYIGDMESKKIYASTTLELHSVGSSTHRAFINALHSINSENNKVRDFISKGLDKIIEYYDTHFNHIITKAKRAESLHHYDEAIWMLSLIPECSVGYSQATELIVPLVQKHLDQDGESFLAQAQTAWAKSPDVVGAAIAFDYLNQIDPLSNAYDRAKILADEIKESINDDREFELHQKYNDELQTRRLLINTAREIGIAYGKGQPPVYTSFNWIR